MIVGYLSRLLKRAADSVRHLLLSRLASTILSFHRDKAKPMFQGSMVALVTPMRLDGSIDYAALERLVDWHAESGTDAIISVGTTGESATLDHDEHIQVIASTVKFAAGRVPVIAGTGSNSTSEAIGLTQAASKVGVAACLLVTPYYNKPPQEGLYRHFKALAEAVDIPQILYNVPGRTVVDLAVETTARLSSLGNIIGIKDATGDMQRARDLKQACERGFELYSGDDGTTLDFIAEGGLGCISVTANVAPGMMHEMCELALAGEVDQAKLINDKLAALHKGLFCEPSPSPAKWALYNMGLIENGIRLPMIPLSEAGQAQVRSAMAQAGIPTN